MWACAAVALLVAAACTSGAEPVPAGSAVSQTPSRASPAAPTDQMSPSTVAIAPTALPSSVSAAPSDDQSWFEPGTVLTVFGTNGALNAQAQPAPYAPLAAYLRLNRDIVATGRARQTAEGLWVEARSPRDAAPVWADRRFLGVEGPTLDVAAEIPASEGAPAAATVLDLGATVLDRLGYDPAGLATVVLDLPPVRGRQDSVTYDIRRGDRLVLGERLRMTAAAVDASEGTYEVQRVERTVICARAVTAAGKCR